MNDREFNAGIRAAYEQALKSGGMLDRLLLVQKIMSQHAPAEGPDADWYLCGTYRSARAEVEKLIRVERDRVEEDEQSTLPGFQWVQPAYSIQRGDRCLRVPTPAMSVSEVRAKAKELRRMGFGLLKHAEELERYADMRDAAGGHEHRAQ